ncbi:Pnap_2097 family protein [Ideonella sp. YS5]|uniref:Pnap_2097 family protein n=1 Tax=Ideonella sp. YS5 TaxID=3453714 RepID=UPI003EEA2C76
MGWDRFAPLSTEVPLATTPPSASAQRSRTSLLLGMPQLDACGLSENWLQKTCGDRHWQALARLIGRRPADWRDTRGNRVYAAFGYLRLSHARLETAQEGRRLAIATELQAAGRSQVHSRHRLSTQGRPIGVLDLLSSFVAREASCSNRKVRRIEGLLPVVDPDADAAATQQRARALRASLDVAAEPGLPALVVHPCPRHDFNGAGLLYFASFGAWVDRALWQWGRLTPGLRVRERECAFLGNADPGEAMRVRLVSAESDGGTIRWRVRLSTVAEERPLAVTVLVAHG